MFTQQNLTDVFWTGHSDEGFAQKVSFENISMFLASGDVKAGSLLQNKSFMANLLDRRNTPSPHYFPKTFPVVMTIRIF